MQPNGNDRVYTLVTPIVDPGYPPPSPALPLKADDDGASSAGADLSTPADDGTPVATSPHGLTCVGIILPRHSGAAALMTVWEDLKTRGGPISFYEADNSTLVKTLSKRDLLGC